MTREELNRRYWRYYLLLEKRFIQPIEYVELSESNYRAYSDVYAMLIQTIGAELDNLFKEYCNLDKAERHTISNYVREIDREESDENAMNHAKLYPFRNQEITVKPYGIIIKPFENWDCSCPCKSLAWWEAFDAIKHNRIDNKKMANQENCLNILGALFFLEMKLLKKNAEKNINKKTTQKQSLTISKSNEYVCDEDEVDIFDNSSELFMLKEWTSLIPKDMETIELFQSLLNGGKVDKKLYDV